MILVIILVTIWAPDIMLITTLDDHKRFHCIVGKSSRIMTMVMMMMMWIETTMMEGMMKAI